jgi:SAM-dependent methyltransferase
VLQHLDNPTRALAEMVRVARPGARLVASEPDWGTLAVDLPADTVTRRLLDRADRAGRLRGRLNRATYLIPGRTTGGGPTGTALTPSNGQPASRGLTESWE